EAASRAGPKNCWTGTRCAAKVGERRFPSIPETRKSQPVKTQRTLRPAAFFAAILFLLASVHAGPVSITLAPVGDSGNVADTTIMTLDGTTGYGSVGYNYNIGKYDVTDSQYAAFLNAVDPSGANALQLYNANMATGTQGGVTWNGSQYVVNSGYANKPVVY